MGVAENKRIVQAFYEAGNSGDMDRCLALMADDIVWTNITTTPTATSSGFAAALSPR